MGGTDINEYVHQQEPKLIMDDVLNKCSKIVAFHEKQKIKCLEYWNHVKDKIVCIPPSPDIPPIDNFSLFSELNLSLDKKFFLLPCGIRPVKDPLYLVEAFSKIHQGFFLKKIVLSDCFIF